APADPRLVWAAMMLCRRLDACRRVLACEQVAPRLLDPDIAQVVLGARWPFKGEAPTSAAWILIALDQLAAAVVRIEEIADRAAQTRRETERARDFAAWAKTNGGRTR